MKTHRFVLALVLLAGCAASEPAPPEGRFKPGQAVLLMGETDGCYVFRLDADTSQEDWIIGGTKVPPGADAEVVEDIRPDRLVTILVTSGPKKGLQGRVYNTTLRLVTSASR